VSRARHKWQVLAESDSGATPEWTPNGIPECPHDGGCTHYDGKRCALSGARPGLVCGPIVEEMANQLAENESARREAGGGQ
jgi:hypothetical protein